MKATGHQTAESFNEEFCQYLEFQLCRAFAHSPCPDVQDFWCDGVAWIPQIDAHITKKHVNAARRIETHAWLGKTGQDRYAMIIRLGEYSLRRYAKGASLIECIPSEDQRGWMTIDPDNKTIEIQLK